MLTAQTALFGDVDYAEDSTVEFPAGLPAFESERYFITLHQPDYQPLIFLQSLTTPSLSFFVIPVDNIVLGYELDLTDEETCLLGGPSLASELQVLALVAVSEREQVSANLRAPLVIHRERRRGVQAIQSNAAYSYRHPLGMGAATHEETPCS